MAAAGSVLGLFFWFVTQQRDFSGRLRLPVGSGVPAIRLGERHGLILASDGSLWSWGSDFLGWPVLGLGSNVMKSTSLRRIGHETNWVGIWAWASRNLALKSDGTLWTWGQSVAPHVLFAKPQLSYEPVLAAPGHDWKQAAAGGNVFVAIKKDGTLWGWGNNWAGSAGIPSKTGSSAPVQIGASTNWVKVWAGLLETLGQQSDGSLWYWGENPNPSIPQASNCIVVPTRMGPETNWVDIGFGVNTVFAIKSDGTLWVWGRQADRYTGTTDPAQDAIPTRIGTDSDWRSFTSAPGWWCNGLIKKDGSLWFMDASEGNANTPPTPYKPVQFRQLEFKDYAAFSAGATHAATSGVHGPIGVVLTREGEVWTWGMVLGDPPTLKSQFETFGARIAHWTHPTNSFSPPDADPIYRNKPWQLRNIDGN